MNLKYRYYIYILTNRKNGTLYIGSTPDLQKRLNEHRQKLFDGFTKKYNIDKLIYVEEFLNKSDAIIRERQLKKWNRKWKTELIEKHNPNWNDLSKEITRNLSGMEVMDILFGKNKPAKVL